MSERSAETAHMEKWREAGWESPDAVLDALTEAHLRLSRVREAVAEAQVMDRRGPEQFKTGQGHLPPAFREVNWHGAFTALAQILSKVETAVEPVTPPTEQATP